MVVPWVWSLLLSSAIVWLVFLKDDVIRKIITNPLELDCHWNCFDDETRTAPSGFQTLPPWQSSPVQGVASFPTTYIPIYDNSDDKNAVTTMSLSVIYRHSRAIYILQEAWSKTTNSSTSTVRRTNNFVSRSISSKFRVQLPPPLKQSPSNLTTTYKLQTVSQQAIERQCEYAINAGPFHADASPVGSLVVHPNRIVADIGNNPSMVGFGLQVTHGSTNKKKQGNIRTTRQTTLGVNNTPTKQWVFGSLSGFNQLLQLQDFVTGFGWLVYEGRNVVIPSDDNDGGETGAVRAPRTAIGVTTHGQLILVVADGCEHCLLFRGLTLHELADVLVEHNAAFAINLDGGSSSVLVINGTVQSRPTCWDVLQVKCERPVSSIICLTR